MGINMDITTDGVQMIAGFEGYRNKAYQCSAGVWTIGYGTTVYPNGTKVKSGDTCTQAQALTWFKNDLTKFTKVVNNSVTTDIGQKKFNALTSFAYNCGSLGNNMKTYINARKFKKAANQFDLFVNVTTNGVKQVVLGLVKRRLVEKLCFYPSWTPSKVTMASNRLTILWAQQKMNAYAKAKGIKGWITLTEDGLWGQNTFNGINIIRKYLGWKQYILYRNGKVTKAMITKIA